MAKNRLSRGAVAHSRAPALNVDHDLAGDRAAQLAARLRTGSDPHALPDADTLGIELAFPHQAGDLDHRTFVRFDLRHQFLRCVHADVHAFRNVDAARLIGGAAAGREDITLRASGNCHAHRILGHGLLFLGSQRTARRGDDDDGENNGLHKNPHSHGVNDYSIVNARYISSPSRSSWRTTGSPAFNPSRTARSSSSPATFVRLTA